MLLALVEGLAAGGIEVRVPIDVRLFGPSALDRIAASAEIVAIQPDDSLDYVEVWCQLANVSQWTWLVAPELQSALQHTARRLRQAGARLLNASHDFLACASDKHQMAEALLKADIPHPLTRSLQNLNAESGTHLPSVSIPGEQRWVVKPIDGAGCEGLRIVDGQQLVRLQKQFRQRAVALPVDSPHSTPHCIVQPWLPGMATSCSAIVDASGQAHWLPLVSQDFEVTSNPSQESTLRYLGYAFPAPGILQGAPVELLDRVLQSIPGTALGWIGIDLLYDPLQAQWWVIEVNPRCTTSLVGLARGYRGNLVLEAFRLQTGLQAKLTSEFYPNTFRIA